MLALDVVISMQTQMDTTQMLKALTLERNNAPGMLEIYLVVYLVIVSFSYCCIVSHISFVFVNSIIRLMYY